MSLGPAITGLSPRARGNRWPAGLRGLCTGSIPACTGEPCICGSRSCLPPVYPRVHGGTDSPGWADAVHQGLSPRARGNRAHDAGLRAVQGSIPACTGEPLYSVSCESPYTVYPRVHGGTPSIAHTRSSGHGLSPRARGNLGIASGLPATRGSIPACTGEPPHSLAHLQDEAVYPRVHGGTHGDHSLRMLITGLSPRARGNPHKDRDAVRRQRSIPACTGEPRTGCGP